MIRKIDFRNNIDPIKGYIPGVSRGDAGFITTLEYKKTLA